MQAFVNVWIKIVLCVHLRRKNETKGWVTF